MCCSGSIGKDSSGNYKCCGEGYGTDDDRCCPTVASKSDGSGLEARFGNRENNGAGRCCASGEKEVNNLCCADTSKNETTINPARDAYTCCGADDVLFDWTGRFDNIDKYNNSRYPGVWKICCPKGSAGYAVNEKKCCTSTVIDGHCCPAGSTHYAKDINGNYTCCDDDHYADAGTWIKGPEYDEETGTKISDGVFSTSPTCTDGTDRWVPVHRYCTEAKISCPRTSSHTCGTDCCGNDEKFCNYDWYHQVYYCCRYRHEDVRECKNNLSS